MAEKALTLQILKQNQDGTLTALVKDDGPGSGPPMPQGIRARINGINVWFESQADLLKADEMLRGMTGMEGGEEAPELGRGRPSRGGGMGGGSGGAGLLRTGGDVAQTVGAFLAGRGLRNKRDDLLRAMNDVDNARSQLDALTNKYGDLVPVLGQIFDRYRDENSTAISILDDEILALDIQAGAGLADTISDFWDTGNGNFGAGSGSGTGAALAAGGLGLGLGLLLSNRGRSSGPYRPRR